MLDREFVLDECLGQGGSSRVYFANHPHTDKNYAVKILRKDKGISHKRGVQILQEEHDRMQLLQGHPNILKSFGTFHDGELISDLGLTSVMYNVLELAENGTSSHFIRKSGGLGENLVKFPFVQIWHALSFIHSSGVAHMDMKLDNILFDEHYNIKIADLGVALNVSKTDGFTDSQRGTLSYMAPEVSYLLPTETYNAYIADIYSLGIWLYVLVFGEFPVKDDSEDSTFCDTDTIGGITGLKCSLGCKKKWEQVSLDLQELLGNMLSMEPEDRPSLQQILESPWISKAYEEYMPQYVFEEMEKRKNISENKETYTKNEAESTMSFQYDL